MCISAKAALPAGVAEAIGEQEARSEILIGWVQLAIGAIFGTLYAVAPRAQGDPMMGLEIEPVPLALSAYLAFTLARLALAYRRFTPSWFLALSIAIDMALLMGLIWSFHIQYEQPPAFYLKAPTLLYVFIFISLRALRFDSKFVLTAGIAAAVGWLAMAYYAVAADPTGTAVTRDYVAYLTGNKILLGAEFDKVISILMVTAILTLALRRARRLLVDSVQEATASRELKRFFAPEIADAIAHGDRPMTAGDGLMREAAILMVDIRGFTARSASLPPDRVIALLTDYQARIVPAIRAHGGAIDKFMGDGIMATFGAARPSPTAAADALRSLDAVLEAAGAWTNGDGAAPLKVNAGLAWGPVVFGAVGDGERLEFTVIGDAVNLAAKLEKHNKAEGVRATIEANALDAALAQGYRPRSAVERLRDQTVAGIETPLDLAVVR